MYKKTEKANMFTLFSLWYVSLIAVTQTLNHVVCSVTTCTQLERYYVF